MSLSLWPIDQTTQRWAHISRCGLYRYVLGRRWNFFAIGRPESPRRYVAFIGINPSKADAEVDDPTITRCIRFAKGWGFDGLLMLNCFAYRSTDPKALKSVAEPRGLKNLAYLRLMFESPSVQTVVAAWGNNATLEQQAFMTRLAAEHGRQLHCLGFTSKGKPRHPLMLQKSLTPEPWLVDAVA